MYFWQIFLRPNAFSFRLKFMKVAAQTCDEWFGSEMRKHFDDNFTDSSFLSDIAQMAPTLEDTMVYCKLFNWVSNCSEIVFPIYTTEGLCFTFNSMNINDILTDEWVFEESFEYIAELAQINSIYSTIVPELHRNLSNCHPYRRDPNGTQREATWMRVISMQMYSLTVRWAWETRKNSRP